MLYYNIMLLILLHRYNDPKKLMKIDHKYLRGKEGGLSVNFQKAHLRYRFSMFTIFHIPASFQGFFRNNGNVRLEIDPRCYYFIPPEIQFLIWNNLKSRGLRDGAFKCVRNWRVKHIGTYYYTLGRQVIESAVVFS